MWAGSLAMFIIGGVITDVAPAVLRLAESIVGVLVCLEVGQGCGHWNLLRRSGQIALQPSRPR
jgi:hypothetical protein